LPDKRGDKKVATPSAVIVMTMETLLPVAIGTGKQAGRRTLSTHDVNPDFSPL